MGDVFLLFEKPSHTKYALSALAFVLALCCIAAPCIFAVGNGACGDGANSADEAVAVQSGYGLFIDDAFIAACGDYSVLDTAVGGVADTLAGIYGAPEGTHSIGNAVNVVFGTYPTEAFVTGSRLAELLGIYESTVELEVSDYGGNGTGIELTVLTSAECTVTEEVEAPVVAKPTDMLDDGVSVVISCGESGTSENRYSLFYINGTLTEKVLEESTVLEEPIAEEQWYGTSDGATLLSADACFALPYDGIITSRYGYRVLWDSKEFHNGIDFAQNGGCYGDPIYAAHDGVVSFAGVKGGYGKAVMIDHTLELTSLYAHCSELAVEEGQYVRKGQLIAYIGNTGRVTGAHLHFSMFKNGVICDPTPYLDWSGYSTEN